MPETLETLTAATIKQSIARVEMFTEAALNPDEWLVVFHFEDGIYGPDGKLLQPTQFGTRRVERRFGDIKGDPDIVALVVAIKAKAYAYRQENIDADRAAASAAAQEASTNG